MGAPTTAAERARDEVEAQMLTWRTVTSMVTLCTVDILLRSDQQAWAPARLGMSWAKVDD